MGKKDYSRGLNAMEVVLITYRNTDRALFDIIAEFFKMLGIFVVEINASMQHDVDFFDGQENLNVSLKIDIERVYDECATVDNIVNLLLIYLQKQDLIKDKNFREASNCLNNLNDRYDLLRNAVTLQNFKDSFCKKSDTLEIYEQTKNNFREASNFIIESFDKESFGNNRFLRYLYICCKQKANLITIYEDTVTNNNILRYNNLEDLGYETMSLLSDFPDFTGAWVLLGNIYEIHARYNNETIGAYSRALRAIGKQVYSSSIYYLLGKKYEKYFGLSDNICNRYYQISKDMRPDYYNIYKIAAIAMNQKNFMYAIEMFNQCLLWLKEKQRVLSPLELEYYYKVCMHISYCYIKLRDYSSTIRYAKLGLRLKEDIKNGDYDGYFQEMYGDGKFNIYVQEVLRQMNENSAFRYLSEAYMMIGVREWSIDCLDKAKEN